MRKFWRNGSNSIHELISVGQYNFQYQVLSENCCFIYIFNLTCRAQHTMTKSNVRKFFDVAKNCLFREDRYVTISSTDRRPRVDRAHIQSEISSLFILQFFAQLFFFNWIFQRRTWLSNRHGERRSTRSQHHILQCSRKKNFPSSTTRNSKFVLITKWFWYQPLWSTKLSNRNRTTAVTFQDQSNCSMMSISIF